MSDAMPNLRDLFEAAVGLDAHAREQYLDRQCADAEQRRLVQSMLAADGVAGAQLLDQPFDRVLERIGDAEPDSALSSGTPVGPFVIREKLGEGGSSVVYRAEREQLGVRQNVALKLLRRGLYSDEERRRFRRERFALAQLRHPGIARLIEGGVTDGGVPYIALELVRGEPITDYVRNRQLDLHQRLQLFIAACRAVEAAHRALIVHRDLKPSNVLTTPEGEVKLLDFGIAKLLEAEPDDAALQTQHHAMTPAYAAPEQFSHGTITTATDVYALGILLDELITGRRREPGQKATPSSRLGGKTGETSPFPAPVARSKVRGDLDNIVVKATAAVPEMRYASAGALADDIERHLAGQPIAAHPPSRWYRTRKFVVRHKAGVLMSAAFLIAVFVALGAALWQAKQARLQAQRADAVQSFLVDVFQSNSSSQPDPVKARATSARELLALGAKKIDGAMNDAPQAKLRMLLLLGDMHYDLGLDEDAARQYRKAVDLAHAVYGDDAVEAFDAQMKLADALHSANSDNDVESVLKQAQASLDRRGDNDAIRRAQLADQFAQFYATRNVPLALEQARASVGMYERADAAANLALALSRKARIEHSSGLDSEAAASYARAIAISRSVNGESNADLPRYYAELAELQIAHRHIAEGERNARDALQSAETINGENHVDVIQCEMRLGRLLFDTGRTQEALALLASAKRKVLAVVGADDGFHAPQVFYQNGSVLIRVGRIEDGLLDVQTAISNRRRNRPGTISLAQFLAVAGAAEVELGQFAQAQKDLDEARDILGKTGQKVPSFLFDAYYSPRTRLALALEHNDEAAQFATQLYLNRSDEDGLDIEDLNNGLLGVEVEAANGRATRAIEQAASIRARIERSPLAKYYAAFVARANFIEGQARWRNGDCRAAEPLLERALAQRADDLDAISPKIAETQIVMAECYREDREFAKARALANSAATILAKHKVLGPQYEKPLQHVLDELARDPK